MGSHRALRRTPLAKLACGGRDKKRCKAFPVKTPVRSLSTSLRAAGEAEDRGESNILIKKNFGYF